MRSFWITGVIEEPNRFQPIDGFRLYYKGGSNKVKETSAEKEQARIAKEKWGRYEEVYAPFQELYIDQVDRLNTDKSRDLAKGLAAQDTAQAFSDTTERAQDSLTAAGINPASGRFTGTTTDIATSQGESAGENMTRAEMSQGDEFLRGKQNILAIGNDQATTAHQGMSSLAQSSAAKARSDAANAFNESSADQQSLGSAVGFGLAAYNPQPATNTTAYAGRTPDLSKYSGVA